MIRKMLIAAIALIPSLALAGCAASSERPAGHWERNTSAGGRDLGMIWVRDLPTIEMIEDRSETSMARGSGSGHWARNTAGGGRDLGMRWVRD